VFAATLIWLVVKISVYVMAHQTVKLVAVGLVLAALTDS
jgi:hypothetical protein